MIFFKNLELFYLSSGMRQVSNEEVIAAHRGTKLSVEEVGYLGMTSNMFQFVDIFSIPEITILRDVIQVNQIDRKEKLLTDFLFNLVFCR